MKILVVDDDESIRELLALALQSAGHEVVTAVDGLAALEILGRGPLPSMILLDMMLPRLDGEGLAHRIRADPRMSHVPIVVVSGHQAAREKAAQLGAEACLVKPIELTDLLATVQAIESRLAAPA